jgi:nucleoside-diphosphate-sugar epimerase
LDVVTGAFSFSGKYIAELLLARGREVRTLTRHPQSASPFGDRVQAFPLDFADRAGLEKALRDADTLYNTYWIRSPREGVTFELAVANTELLLRAAREAGVRRVVQLSVSKASSSSALPYFRGKALAEEALASSGLSYAIVRPTLIYAREDVLVNNIAWLLRRLPVFVVPGDGRYTLQPVAVEDVAKLAVDLGVSDAAEVVDAAGPDVFTFDELVRLVREAVRSRARVVHASLGVTQALGSLLGVALRDTLITRAELQGLMENLLTSDGPATGRRRFEDWLHANAATVGTSYTSETRRNWS